MFVCVWGGYEGERKKKDVDFVMLVFCIQFFLIMFTHNLLSMWFSHSHLLLRILLFPFLSSELSFLGCPCSTHFFSFCFTSFYFFFLHRPLPHSHHHHRHLSRLRIRQHHQHHSSNSFTYHLSPTCLALVLSDIFACFCLESNG